MHKLFVLLLFLAVQGVLGAVKTAKNPKNEDKYILKHRLIHPKYPLIVANIFGSEDDKAIFWTKKAVINYCGKAKAMT
jgi:hypothetical protein